jgi:hypothetical protein
MKKILSVLIILFSAGAASAGVSDSIQFPDRNRVSAQKAFFFWQDLSGDEMQKSIFRVSLKRGEKPEAVFEAKPVAYKGFFYLIAPFPLTNGELSYEISPLYDGKPDTNRYFGFRHYPVKGSFTADSGEKPEDVITVIDFLAASQENEQTNRLNALFFGGGAVVCGGIAALFFTALDFDIWTRIIGTAFAAGSITGVCASSWYGYQYISTKTDLDTKNRSLKKHGIQLSFSSAL